MTSLLSYIRRASLPIESLKILLRLVDDHARNIVSKNVPTGRIAELTRMEANLGRRRMTSYTKSGMNASPNCSSSLVFKRILSFSTETAESITGNSRMNKILDGKPEISSNFLCSRY